MAHPHLWMGFAALPGTLLGTYLSVGWSWLLFCVWGSCLQVGCLCCFVLPHAVASCIHWLQVSPLPLSWLHSWSCPPVGRVCVHADTHLGTWNPTDLHCGPGHCSTSGQHHLLAMVAGRGGTHLGHLFGCWLSSVPDLVLLQGGWVGRGKFFCTLVCPCLLFWLRWVGVSLFRGDHALLLLAAGWGSQSVAFVVQGFSLSRPLEGLLVWSSALLLSCSLMLWFWL